MAEVGGKIRLFVEADLGPGAVVALRPDQAHYLFAVMRLGAGGRVSLFNGRDGEWLAEVAEAGRKDGRLAVVEAGQAQRRPPDLTLLFAPIKKARTDFIVEKATELGCARIQPIFTRHTNSERLRLDRLRAHAIEAAEQCGETYVPELAEPARLDRLLDAWDPARRLMFCDEARAARPAAEILAAEILAPESLAPESLAPESLAPESLAPEPPGPWAILIGPEGGFAPEEGERLRGLPFVRRVTLGPRVLRADTAAVAAITLWQASLGDWR